MRYALVQAKNGRHQFQGGKTQHHHRSAQGQYPPQGAFFWLDNGGYCPIIKMRAVMGVNFASDIQLITEAILNNIEVKSIYLFGSYAYGNPTENSDIDIYAVLPDKYDNTTEIYAKIITELSDKNIFFIDLLLVPEKVFDSRKNKYILETTIFNRGKILYESQ